MDESGVSLNMPWEQLKQLTKKWQPGPLKAKVHATRTKQMVLAFFYIEGLIYTIYIQRGKKINSDYTMEALFWFLAIFKKFKKKLPTMVAGEQFSIGIKACSTCRHGGGVDGSQML
jgi:hypothetical protein